MHPRWARRAGLAVGTLVAASGSALAHVTYVTDETGGNIDPVHFLISVLSNPVNAGLIGAVGIATVGVLAGDLYLYESAPFDIHVLCEELTGGRGLPSMAAPIEHRASTRRRGSRAISSARRFRWRTLLLLVS